MKKFLCPFFFILLSLSLPAQKMHADDLLGSWRIYGGTILQDSAHWQYISFFSGYDYQAVRVRSVYDSTAHDLRRDTVLETGSWSFARSGDLYLYDRAVRTGASHARPEATLYFSVLHLDDTSLVISAGDGDSLTSALCSRTASIGMLGTTEPVFDDDSYYSRRAVNNVFLVNSMDTTRRIQLDNIVSFEVECPPDTSVSECISYVQGYIASASDTFFRLDRTRESREITYHSGAQGSYELDHYSDRALYTYDTRQIRSFTYSSLRRDNARNYFTSIAACSFFTAFLIAPLVSIDYAHWGFYPKRYFTVAGIGLAGMVVCIPIASLLREKEYKLTTRSGFKSKNYWYVEQY